MQPYEFSPGETPLLISMPHPGTALLDEVRAGMTETAARLPDTDWHVDLLYAFARDLGASVLCARYSRFNVDLNRPSDDTPLYRTATTGLFPDVLFEGEPVYRPGEEPSPAVRERALREIWSPYHQQLAAELARLKTQYGHVVLFDAHSIRSVVPRLFDGRLPDFNIGTDEGRSAPAGLVTQVADVCRAAEGYTTVVDGRFKGGHITRHYGDPRNGIHAVQLELAQRTYMDETWPFDYRPERAAQVQAVLRRFVETLLAWAPPS